MAFFHQWVHSAATGGPWASPLILEPQGFFDQVHTHLVLPAVVAVYAMVPDTITLLILHTAFVSLAVWPVMRLGTDVAGGRFGLLMVIAVAVFGPFQAVAVADFRPIGLFLPGIIGVWSGAWRGSAKAIVFWSLIALLGRQEAAYLLAGCGLSLMVCSWGKATRRQGLVLILMGVSAWLFFAATKPEMFFHINPMAPPQPSLSPELWDNRTHFALAFLLSGWAIGLLKPAPLLAAVPVFLGMLLTSREWHALTGPGAHHHAFWLPFVFAAAIAGVGSKAPRWGAVALILTSAVSFPWAALTSSSVDTKSLTRLVPRDVKVAADYDTIHLFAGRDVLWNIDQLYMDDRPWHWRNKWPLTIEDVDWIITPKHHPMVDRVKDWTQVTAVNNHLVLKRPDY